MKDDDENDIRMCDSYEEYSVYLHKRKKKDVEIMKLCDFQNKSADEILKMCGQENSIPVDLKKILSETKISVMPLNFGGIQKTHTHKILGAMISDGENAAIFYDSEEKENSHRYRFTIAHELAHYCISGESDHIRYRHDNSDPCEEEKAANTFAGALLIPESSLRKVIGELLLPSVSTLADIFEVSHNVMRERLKYLNLQEGVLD